MTKISEDVDNRTPPDMSSMVKAVSAPRYTLRSIITWILLHAGNLLIALVAFCAFELFKLYGKSIPSVISLVVAAGFGLAPLRALSRELFKIEGKVLHLAHGVGGLALGGLALSGVIPGGPLLSQAAVAPFSIMGAAQALTHSEHPRDQAQADALRRFITSLPEIEQFTRSEDLTSPDNARRAVKVLTDLIAKAQALGETELKSDPGFQSALQKATMRFGLSMGLDAIARSLDRLSANPAASTAVPDLRKRIGAVRKVIGEG